MPRVVLVNPANATAGYSLITPRWLFVLAAATPPARVGDPIVFDETIRRFDPDVVERGDIVGIGISSGNCRAGYRVLRESKRRGARVIVGGIHATIFPDEPLEMGADAVVTGNGDLIWSQVVEDALDDRLKKRYDGGRLPGEALRKARWDLLDPRCYAFASVQTVVGCPENCSFCSVWVTEGRAPRQRLAEKVIEEVNELHAMGFRCLIFADDNFNPATLGRIAREPSPARRRELEKVRQERLRFFEEYDRQAPRNIYALTQMTTEVISDDEYLSAMYHKMRVRGALIGVESFSEQGLECANKRWNPSGQRMVETIRRIQDAGIWVLSSMICGLESDTKRSIRAMKDFACESGTMLAQFTIYGPYPGTKDFHEMMNDRRNRSRESFVPKHRTEIVQERFWLTGVPPAFVIRHANLSAEELLAENRKCWEAFYSWPQILWRTWRGVGRPLSLAAKLVYVCACLALKRLYAGQGVSADSVQGKRGPLTRALLKLGIGVYNRICRPAAKETPGGVSTQKTRMELS